MYICRAIRSQRGSGAAPTSRAAATAMSSALRALALVNESFETSSYASSGEVT